MSSSQVRHIIRLESLFFSMPHVSIWYQLSYRIVYQIVTPFQLHIQDSTSEEYHDDVRLDDPFLQSLQHVSCYRDTTHSHTSYQHGCPTLTQSISLFPLALEVNHRQLTCHVRHLLPTSFPSILDTRDKQIQLQKPPRILKSDPKVTTLIHIN